MRHPSSRRSSRDRSRESDKSVEDTQQPVVAPQPQTQILPVILMPANQLNSFLPSTWGFPGPRGGGPGFMPPQFVPQFPFGMRPQFDMHPNFFYPPNQPFMPRNRPPFHRLPNYNQLRGQRKPANQQQKHPGNSGQQSQETPNESNQSLNESQDSNTKAKKKKRWYPPQPKKNVKAAMKMSKATNK